MPHPTASEGSPVLDPVISTLSLPAHLCFIFLSLIISCGQSSWPFCLLFQLDCLSSSYLLRNTPNLQYPPLSISWLINLNSSRCSSLTQLIYLQYHIQLISKSCQFHLQNMSRMQIISPHLQYCFSGPRQFRLIPGIS